MALKVRSSKKVHQPADPQAVKQKTWSRLLRPLRGKKQTVPQQPQQFESLGGVFATESSLSDDDRTSKSNSTDQTHSSQDDAYTWTKSDSKTHHKGSPIVARSILSQRDLNADPTETEEAVLRKVMHKARQLPPPSGMFCSNHIMLNTERTTRFVRPLSRNRDLDELARRQAVAMAQREQLFHSDIVDSSSLFGDGHVRVGENVSRGPELEGMHIQMMSETADKNNILDRRFTCMGIGTSKASDGTLYLCQIFLG